MKLLIACFFLASCQPSLITIKAPNNLRPASRVTPVVGSGVHAQASPGASIPETDESLNERLKKQLQQIKESWNR